MNTIEEDPLPYISPSVVQFSTQIDEIELKPESNWNPDWTIQNEVSITIDKSVNNPPKYCTCKRKISILIGIVIFILLILSIILPIIILSTNSNYSSTTTKNTPTTSIGSNPSNGKVEINWCENLLNIENKNFIGFDLYWENSVSWSTCCLSCLNVSSCHAFTYEIFSSKCYLKSMINDNQIIDKRYQSGKLI